jgi:hypothetical protein
MSIVMNARLSIVSVLVVSTILVATALSNSSQRVIAQTITTPESSCTSANPCIEGHNLGSGVGVRGVAIKASGVVGSTKFNSTSVPGKSGVFGLDDSQSGGFNSGVYGMSQLGTGVSGQSGITGGSISAGTGVSGVTNNDSTVSSHTAYGVVGIDNDPNFATSDSGVYGLSKNGAGVYGRSTTFAGVSAVSINGFGLLADSGTATGALIFTQDTQHAALALSTKGGTSSQPILTAHSNFNAGEDVFSVAADGTVVTRGTFVANGSPLVISRTSPRGALVTYTARQTRATIEDVGEATLVRGAAYIPIDRKFASTISPGAPYFVFITPQGDTAGWLYVSSKTAAGFFVREHNGASNIAFDYRIVAQSANENGERLPAASSLAGLPLATDNLAISRIKETNR